MAIEKGGVSQIVNGLRFVDGGEIISLSEPFTKGAGSPFSIKLIPKDAFNDSEYEMVDLVFYQSDSRVPQSWPIDVMSWSAELLIEISQTNSSLLDNYRIFWATGSDILN